MLVAMLWSTQGSRYSSIFEAINAIASHLAPPITTVFLWGVFWKRATKQAALTTLITGFSLGALAFLFDLPVIGHEKLLTHKLGIPFLMQAWWMFCLCSLIFVFVSLLTPRPDPRQVEAMTWKNPLQVIAGGRIKNLSDPRLWAGVLLAVMAVLYYLLR
jgi:SSS family solute:Na+ symporter